MKNKELPSFIHNLSAVHYRRNSKVLIVTYETSALIASPSGDITMHSSTRLETHVQWIVSTVCCARFMQGSLLVYPAKESNIALVICLFSSWVSRKSQGIYYPERKWCLMGARCTVWWWLIRTVGSFSGNHILLATPSLNQACTSCIVAINRTAPKIQGWSHNAPRSELRWAFEVGPASRVSTGHIIEVSVF